MRKLHIFILLFALTETSIGHANEDCISISEKSVKIEAWVSKKYEQDYRKIRLEFAEMGNTKVGLFFYPAENPSRVVAIGRCIPAYMAQHFLKKAWKYSPLMKYLVTHEILYRLTVDARNEKEAIDLAENVPYLKWDNEILIREDIVPLGESPINPNPAS